LALTPESQKGCLGSGFCFGAPRPRLEAGAKLTPSKASVPKERRGGANPPS